MAAGSYRRVSRRLCHGRAGVQATAAGRSIGARSTGWDHSHRRDPLSYSPDVSRRETHDDRRDGFFDV